MGLPWHLDKDHPLPPAGLPSLSHVHPVGSVQGSPSLGGCLSDQLGLEGVDDSHVPTPVQFGIRTSAGLASVPGSRDLSSLVAPKQTVWVTA
jgi:hypothetical protein